MTTDCLFREDSYLAECTATVIGFTDQGGVLLDRTVFYATSGGQPGDRGMIVSSGGTFDMATASYVDPAKTVIAHIPAHDDGARPQLGEAVHARIDWDVRYRRMRMHTALHLLSAILPYPVTGGSVGETESRLDFDIPDAGLDRDDISRKLSDMIAADAPVTARWITDAELAANPALVKTMSVKPPVGSGRVRLVEIAGIDLQPCGGTHVRRTGEIGPARVTQIEKKGKMNRRVRLGWA